MAVTENLYTGNGSTTNYSFTFPYLATTDIKVSLNSVITTAYTFANATTVQFNTAPANGVAIRIYRDTDDSNLNATFYSGSAIRAQDLNDNFTQNLYVTQEAVNTADSATTTAASAVATANTALSNSNTAISTANTASSNATTAVNTANAASATAATAVSTANAASATATQASIDAATAISTANTASANATTAINTANSAASDASTALTLVNSVVSYDPVANVASIPGSPANQDRIEILDSTGIESFTPLTGLPVGFVGASNLTVRLIYNSGSLTWEWVDYSPADPDARYLQLSGGTLTGALTLNADPVNNLEPTTKQYVDTANAAQDATIATKVPRTSTTGSAVLPSGTQAERDVTPASGYIRFNTDVSQFEGYNGTSWASVGGGATGGGADQWALEHDNTITTSYTISSGKNVISAGPITVNTGAVVTVPSGSSWAIV